MNRLTLFLLSYGCESSANRASAPTSAERWKIYDLNFCTVVLLPLAKSDPKSKFPLSQVTVNTSKTIQQKCFNPSILMSYQILFSSGCCTFPFILNRFFLQPCHKQRPIFSIQCFFLLCNNIRTNVSNTILIRLLQY